MPDRLNFTYIGNDAELIDFCAQLNEADTIALDTEFVRKDSYFPNFCLLQISDGSSVACIDPLSLSSLEPLREILDNPAIRKILHSCKQDMEVLFHVFGQLPSNVHDTQIAAALAGIGENIGYSNLITKLLGIHLSKDETLTDWSARPLTSRQLQYAIDDVTYLHDSYRLLTTNLDLLKRLDWLDEDCLSILSPDLYRIEPANAWRRLKGIRHLTHSQIAQLRIIAEWRERVAQSTNIPRTWVMKDDVIYMLAQARSIKYSSIPSIRGLKITDHKIHAEELISEMNKREIQTTIMDDSNLPQQPGIESDSERKSLINRMSFFIRSTSSQLGIGSSTLASRNDLENFLESPPRGRLTSGWRHELVGKTLEQMSISSI